MIDCILRHSNVLTVKGASYRLGNHGIGSPPSPKSQSSGKLDSNNRGAEFDRHIGLGFEPRRQLCSRGV